MVLVVGDQWEQEEWYMSIKKLMEEEQKDEEHVFDEEDDGYCTLPTAAFVKEVRPDWYLFLLLLFFLVDAVVAKGNCI